MRAFTHRNQFNVVLQVVQKVMIIKVITQWNKSCKTLKTAIASNNYTFFNSSNNNNM